MGEIAELIRRNVDYFQEDAVRLHEPVTAKQIRAAESWLDVRFPARLDEMLRAHNGIEISGASVYGVPPSGRRSNIVEATLEIRKAQPEGWQHGHLQISEGPMGNPYFLDLTEARGNHPVCLFQRATGRHCVVASGLPHFLFFFIESRREKLNPDGTWRQPQPSSSSWPMNEEYVIRHNPDITKWKDRGLPWNMDPPAFPVD